MEDPLYTIDFFEKIIEKRHSDIVGITIAKGGRLKIGKNRSKISYILSLFLIMGVFFFTHNVWVTLKFRAKKKLSRYFRWISTPGLESISSKYGIPIDYTDNPNSEVFLKKLSELGPDIIINQSQFIIKNSLLSIPRIGVLNRHNALLPRNRGRLTPFWVLFNEEKETGVSIHFVDEGIDSGPIVVQKRFPISESDTFKSIVEKNYEIASSAMLEALDLLDKGFKDFIQNNHINATYNTIPSFSQSLEYRMKRISRIFD